MSPWYFAICMMGVFGIKTAADRWLAWPFHPVMVVPFANVRFICHAIVDPALYHGGDELIVKNGYLVGVIREIAGMEDVMPTLMSERKAVTMSLALIQKAVAR